MTKTLHAYFLSGFKIKAVDGSRRVIGEISAIYQHRRIGPLYDAYIVEHNHTTFIRKH